MTNPEYTICNKCGAHSVGMATHLCEGDKGAVERLARDAEEKIAQFGVTDVPENNNAGTFETLVQRGLPPPTPHDHDPDTAMVLFCIALARAQLRLTVDGVLGPCNGNIEDRRAFAGIVDHAAMLIRKINDGTLVLRHRRRA